MARRFWGVQGAGGLFYAERTGRVLVQKRSSLVNEPNTWGVWGGKVDDGEELLDALKREIQEETGYTGQLRFLPVYVFKEKRFRYHNFLIVISDEFEPNTNWESSSHIWTRLNSLPQPLHFGLQEALPHYASEIKKLRQSSDLEVNSAIVRAVNDLDEAKSLISMSKPNRSKP